jgi:VanZ family protein
MARTSFFSGHQEHFLAYFLSALTISAVRPRASAARTALWLVPYASVLEMGQLYVPGRHPAFADFYASALGALAGAAIAVVILHASQRIARP